MLASCAKAGTFAIGMHPWPGYETLRLADALGWLPPQLRLIEGKNSTETQAGLQAGKLDAGCLTLDEVLLLRAAGLNMVIIAVLDESVGADVVLARPELRRLTDLAGARIAVETTAVGSLMLTKLLQAAGLDSSAVTIINMPPDRQPEAWQAQRIDVAVCYEPVAGRLEKLGAWRLFDSRRIPGTIFDVLAVRQERLAGQDSILKGLAAGHFRAISHLRHNREDAMRRIGGWRQQSYAEVAESFSGLNLPDAAGNRRMLAPGGMLERATRDLEAVMMASKLLARRVDPAGLIQPRYLPELPA